MNPHLTEEEARAVLSLSTTAHWSLLENYISRLHNIAVKECETAKEDHRYFQGRALELSELTMITEKAKNILSN